MTTKSPPAAKTSKVKSKVSAFFKEGNLTTWLIGFIIYNSTYPAIKASTLSIDIILLETKFDQAGWGSKPKF